MDGNELTQRQRELADFLGEFQEEHGYPPTLAQMAKKLDLASLNSVRSLLAALERKGWVSRDGGLSRGTRLKGWEKAVAAATGRLQGRHRHGALHGSVRYHIGWYTRERRPVFDDEGMVALFRELGDGMAGEHGWTIEGMDITPDSVKVAVRVGADHSPADVARHFRRDSLGERLREKLGRQPLASLWDEGLAVGSDRAALDEAMRELRIKK